MIWDRDGQTWISCTVRGSVITLPLTVYLDLVEQTYSKNELESAMIRATYDNRVIAARIGV